MGVAEYPAAFPKYLIGTLLKSSFTILARRTPARDRKLDFFGVIVSAGPLFTDYTPLISVKSRQPALDSLGFLSSIVPYQTLVSLETRFTTP